MDPRLQLAMIETRQEDLQRQAATRAPRAWPDDGLPARPAKAHSPRVHVLHPAAVVASLLTWR